MNTDQRFRVVTYNVHKCRGLDQRVRPERILRVLREIDADIVALQEILSIEGGRVEDDQARFIAEELGFEYRLGENRRLRGGAYGNLVLSRFPVLSAQNYDLSVRGREERGCLRADLGLAKGHILHVYNVHLGTAYRERPHQTRRLLTGEILEKEDITGARLLLGDFNEWLRGVTSRLLARHFDSTDIRLHLGRSRTYPGVLPFLHLDHIYFDSALDLQGATLHRSRTALMASDHLPIIADFRIAHSLETDGSNQIRNDLQSAVN
jgi:endonuclease/exonuclease/phosphatase family metal-dependent hydrolase